ncbi:phosphoserine phosphatase SerB [Pontiellaceae bacterium B12219]|nr:phosphoserine phosphatase SerB [Pontiellaceae bacterium B12219]
MKEIILLRISGKDKPGVTAFITSILAKEGASILDIGQSVLHENLSLGILIELPESAESSPVLKELLFAAHQHDLRISFDPISENEYENWVSLQGKPRYIVSLLARKLSADHLARASKAVAAHGLNIDGIRRLSGRIPLNETEASTNACIELTTRGTPDDADLLAGELLKISSETGIDIALQEDSIYRRTRRLVCFDMDSTLIQAEVIVELAKAAGVGDQVHEITEAAMRGEIDFTESFVRRVALLKGLDESVLHEIAKKLPLTEGAIKLTHTLKKLGFKTAILSGGFNYFGNYLKEIFNIDYVYANELEIVDGKVTGRVTGTVVDGQRKKELLQEIAAKENIHLKQVIAVGDGANDLPMLSVAGLGIAFHAKPVVKETAKQSISNLGLDSILYLIGVRDRDEIESIPNAR